MQGRGGGSEEVFLTPVMHGVARYRHGRRHGDGGPAHGELVGDRIVSTAAAWTRLASRSSYKTERGT